MTHKYAIGAVVEVDLDLSQPGTEDEIEINLSGTCRLFIVGHDNASDGTPLYVLSDLPVRYPHLNTDAVFSQDKLMYRSFSVVLEFGYEEDSLRPTRQERLLFPTIDKWLDLPS